MCKNAFNASLLQYSKKIKIKNNNIQYRKKQYNVNKDKNKDAQNYSKLYKFWSSITWEYNLDDIQQPTKTTRKRDVSI